MLEIVEEPGGHGQVPVDDADAQTVVDGLAQEVRAARWRHRDELPDLLGQEDLERLGLEAGAPFGDEEQRLKAQIAGTALNAEHDVADVAVPDALLRTAALLAALMAVSPVRTRLTVAVETPAAAATSLIVTGPVTA